MSIIVQLLSLVLFSSILLHFAAQCLSIFVFHKMSYKEYYIWGLEDTTEGKVLAFHEDPAFFPGAHMFPGAPY